MIISLDAYKAGAEQTLASKKIRGRIRCHIGVSILCWPVTLFLLFVVFGKNGKVCRQLGGKLWSNHSFLDDIYMYMYIFLSHLRLFTHFLKETVCNNHKNF